VDDQAPLYTGAVVSVKDPQFGASGDLFVTKIINVAGGSVFATNGCGYSHF
jgi:hypothetical protein